MKRVLVVGGGISGLAAAWELTGGADGPTAASPDVVLLESSARLGGALRSQSFGDRVVDVGPDGFLGRRPEAVRLSHEVGLGDALEPVGGRGAGVWARGRVRSLPDGLALGVPTRFWPAARSGILGWRGTAGLARDVLLPRPDVRGPIGDRSVGPLVARKLGQRVVDLLVDPLIGGIHAGSVDDMSAAAVDPPLLAAAQRRGGLMRALHSEMPPPPDDPAPPLFWALQGGMQRLADALSAELTRRGVAIRCGAEAEQLDRTASGWSVVTNQSAVEGDAAVLAVPAPVVAQLLRPFDEEAAALAEGIDYASVGLVTFRLPADAVAAPLVGTGFLVPRRSRHDDDPVGWAVTACTYLGQKWPHLAQPGEILLRASVGRFGDDRLAAWSDEEVTARVWDELTRLLPLSGGPLDSLVVRFPHAFPQYRVHHLLRTAGIEAAVARLGGIAVAGAAYRGVGIPACIASGRAAALAVQ
jgi:oxygen-dependent protoporphyrinogen oxidase